MKVFIKDLKTGDKLEKQSFVVKDFRLGKTSTGKNFKDLVLGDKTGEIQAKIWQDSLEDCHDFKTNDVVEVSGKVDSYRDKLQLIIKKLVKLEKYDLANFLPSSEKDIEEMYTKIVQYKLNFTNEFLKKLLDNLFKDKKLVEKFKQAPAAEKIHHAHLGGLMEHVLEMLGYVEVICEDYPRLNKDLLVVGIILHDLGKIEELAVDNTIYRSIAGGLIGHLSLGVLMVSKEIDKIKDFPVDLKNQVLHLILSHHGELEFGSPVKPMTLEAIALHYLDQLSSKLRIIDKVLVDNKDNPEAFSARNFALQNKVYLGESDREEKKDNREESTDEEKKENGQLF